MMKNKNHGGKREGSGRKTLDGKPAGIGDRSKRIHVTLSSSQFSWVESQGISISECIRSMIDDRMDEAKEDSNDKIIG